MNLGDVLFIQRHTQPNVATHTEEPSGQGTPSQAGRQIRELWQCTRDNKQTLNKTPAAAAAASTPPQ